MPQVLKKSSLLDDDFFRDDDDFGDGLAEESSEEQVMGLELDFSPTASEEEKIDLVRRYIRAFFKGRQYHSGGDLYPAELETPYYLSLVLRTKFSEGIDSVYEMMGEQSLDYEFEKEDTTMSKDMSKLLSLLSECGSLRIPKRFAIGIIIMYLEICEGFEFAKPSVSKFL